MFMGEYHHSIDEKGRIVVPSKIRELLGTEFIVTRGMDNCLFVYKIDEWNNLILNYKNLPNTTNARNFMRFFLSGAINASFDKQGRINIPNILVDYAHLKKDCVIIGVNDRLEIWDKISWDNFIKTNEENLSDIADKLFSGETNAY